MASGQRDTAIHLQIVDASLPEAIERIAILSEYSISYNPEIFKNESLVTLDTILHVRPLLKYLFTDKPYDIISTRSGNLVIRYDKSKQRSLIYGYVVDSDTGEPLMACHIYQANRRVGTTTNAYGYFAIKVPLNGLPLIFSYLGYEKEYITVDDVPEQRVKIKLSPNADLEEVLIYTSDSLGNAISEQGFVEINPSDFRDQPAAGGEEDVASLIRTQPGVQSGADGIGGLFVRGGTDDQNLVTIDGSTLYFPSHVFGLYSLVNGISMRRAVVTKDKHLIPSGKRLSSSIDIYNRSGNTQKISGAVQVSPSSGRAVLEGPIGQTSSFIFSGRKSIFAPARIIPDHTPLRSSAQTNISFYDYSGKFSTRVGGVHQFVIHYLKGQDQYSYDLNDPVQEYRNFNWGNELFSLKYHVSINAHTFLKASYHDTRFNYLADQAVDYSALPSVGLRRVLSAQSRIHDRKAQVDIAIQHGENQYTRVGIGYTRIQLQQGLRYRGDSSLVNPILFAQQTAEVDPVFETQVGTQLDAYLEEIIPVSEKFKMQMSLFASLYNNEEEYVQLLPKLTLMYQFNPRHSLLLYYQQNVQNIQKVDIDAPGYPTSLWMISNNTIQPKKSSLFSAQYRVHLSKWVYGEIGGFYNEIEDLLFFRRQTGLLPNEDDFTAVNNIRVTRSLSGSAYGLEMSIAVRKPRWSANLNYTWSDTDRLTADDDEFIRPIADRRHVATFLGRYRIKKQLFCSIQQVYASSTLANYTDATFDHAVNGGLLAPIAGYEVSQSPRLESIIRTDINLNWSHKIGRTQHRFSIGVYNVWDRQQTLYRMFDPLATPDAQGVTPALSLGRQFQGGYRLDF